MLPRSSDVLRSIADALDENETTLADLVKRRQDDRLATGLDEIHFHVSRGVSQCEAIIRSARHHNVDPITLGNAWDVAGRLRKSQDLYARRLMAETLVKAGFSDDEIGSILGVHKKHVSRMRKALKR